MSQVLVCQGKFSSGIQVILSDHLRRRNQREKISMDFKEAYCTAFAALGVWFTVYITYGWAKVFLSFWIEKILELSLGWGT